MIYTGCCFCDCSAGDRLIIIGSLFWCSKFDRSILSWSGCEISSIDWCGGVKPELTKGGDSGWIFGGEKFKSLNIKLNQGRQIWPCWASYYSYDDWKNALWARNKKSKSRISDFWQHSTFKSYFETLEMSSNKWFFKNIGKNIIKSALTITKNPRHDFFFLWNKTGCNNHFCESNNLTTVNRWLVNIN